MATMNPDIISTRELQGAVCEALGIDPTRTRRIIIDLQADPDDFIDVYVEMIGDSRLLNIEWDKLEAAEISWSDPSKKGSPPEDQE